MWDPVLADPIVIYATFFWRLMGFAIFCLALSTGIIVWRHFAQFQGEEGDDDGPHRSAD